MTMVSKRWGLGLALAMAAVPALAQMGPLADQYISALKEADFGRVGELTRDEPRVVNMRGPTGETPLMTAVDMRSLQLVSYLLANGADPKMADSRGEVALVASARKGWFEGVMALLEHKADVNGRNRQGETALIAAVQARSPRLVRALLERRADPDIADRLAGFSARDYARRDNRNPEMLRIIEAAKGR